MRRISFILTALHTQSQLMQVARALPNAARGSLTRKEFMNEQTQNELEFRRMSMGTPRGGRSMLGTASRLASARSPRMNFARSANFPARGQTPRGRFGQPPFGNRFRFRPGFGSVVNVDQDAPGGSSFVVAIQNDLADVLGIPVPRNGMLGAATRRAIKMFQRSAGMPMTGRLTRSGLRMLRKRAAQIRGGANDSGFDDSAAPSGSAWTPPAPPAPEPTPPAEDAAPPPAPEGGDEPEPQEEFRLAGSGTVSLHRRATLTLDDPGIDQKLPKRPGLYVITVGPAQTPWYVGMTESSIQDRFRPRWKSLRDFNLGPGDLKGKSITCYTLPSSPPAIDVLFRPGTSGSFRPSRGSKGILLALEEHFIKNLGTAGKGNERRSKITIGDNVTVDLKLIPAAPQHPIDSKIPMKIQATRV